ncbi:hypothetical protein FQN54_000257 [Arachnomyces sp. PD_36]|nr:hypothetical protein FQN54_000257 [Arachnomyces sp. PD_36]
MFSGVKISEVVFRERLSKRKFCAIFLVDVRGKTCVMKVHHGRGPRLPYENKLRQQNHHICESTAYQRLAESGIAGRVTPQFYGVIENIDPALCEPHLQPFAEDEYPPNAILLEYIPDMEELHWTNYTEKRMRNFISGIKEIHDVLIEHSDLYPRNMMVVKGDPERAIWLDFDRAQTFAGPITEREESWIETERRIAEEISILMRDDHAAGKMDKTAIFYY